MTTTYGQRRARLSFVIDVRILVLLLLADFVSACAVDLSKLRMAASSAQDGGTADTIGPEVPAVDTKVVTLPDLAMASEAALPWDLQASSDLEREKAADTPDQDVADADNDLAATAGMDVVSANSDGTFDTRMTGPDSAWASDTSLDGLDSDGISDVSSAGLDIGVADAIPDATAPEDTPVDAAVDLGPPPTVPDPDLVLWYKFDESTGSTAVDSALWNGVARNATLATLGTGTGASATFTSAGKVGSHAVSLAPSTSTYNAGGGYVSLPSLQTLAPDALTIAVWVNTPTSTASQGWARVFDFGTGTTVYMYLTVRTQDGANAPVRFSITKSGYSGEQHLDGLPALGANAWHHIAIVLQTGSTYAGTMYIDGSVVGTNNTMTVHASDLGATTNNWLGRSQWSGSVGSDPFLNGSLDDFRVYRRALSQQEIAAIVAGQ